MDLFSETDDTPLPLLGSTPKPKPPPTPKPEPVEKSAPSSTSKNNLTLYSASALAMILDSNTNQYVKQGQVFIIVTKTNDGKLLILPIGPNKKPITIIECNDRTVWEIQNGVYGSTLDIQQKRRLFMFQTPQIAKTIAIYALSQKSIQEPVAISNGSDELPENLSIQTITIDFNKPNSPLSETKNISKSDTSNPFYNVIQSSKLNSQMIISTSPSSFTFLEISPSEPIIPQAQESNILTSSAQSSKEPTQSPIKSEIKKEDEDQIIATLPDQTDAKSSQISSSKEAISTEKVEKNDKSKDQEKLPIKHLEEILNDRFDQIELMMNGMKPSIGLNSCAVIPHSRLLSQLEKEVNSSLTKDVQLQKLDAMLKKLGRNQIENEENKIIEEEISQVEKELSNLNSENKGKSETKTLKIRIKKLKEQLVQQENYQKESEETIIGELNNLRNQKTEKINKMKADNQSKLQELEETKKMLQDQLDKMKQDNQKIQIQKEDDNKDILNQINEIKAHSSKVVNETVHKFCSEVFHLFSSGIKSDQQYSGEMIIRAIKNVLSTSMEDILNPDEEEELAEEEQNEENDDNEEEEKASEK